jgi:uncharacterized protein (TIGR02444 family)
MTSLSADDFWDFSLRFYANDDVEASCLALQDDYGADVNILILAFYAASRRARLIGPLSSWAGEATQWRDNVIAPIRKSRRALKSEHFHARVPSLRQFKNSLQAVELEAEKIGQRLLVENARFEKADISMPELARLNIETYASELPQSLDSDHVDLLLKAFIQPSKSESSL